TADAAVAADRGDDLVGLAEPDRHLVVQGPGRAVGHAGAARLAAGVEHGGVQAGDDLRVAAAIADAPDEAALYLFAGPHAARTQDALVEVHPDERVGVAVDGVARFRLDALGQPGPVVPDPVLELRFVAVAGGVPGIGVVVQQHLQHEPAGLGQRRRF